MDKCNIGLVTDSECHKTTFSNTQCFHYFKDLKEEDILLLKYRLSNYQLSDQMIKEKICDFHKLKFLDYYTSVKRKCCDPFNRHKKSITAHLRIISLETCQQFQNVLSDKSISLIPGEKICKVCDETLQKMYQAYLESVPQIDPQNNTGEVQEFLSSQEFSSYSGNSFDSVYKTKSQEINAIKNLLNILEIDPLDNDKMSRERFQLKMEQLLLDITHKITEKINAAYDLNITIFDNTVTNNIVTDSKSLKDIIHTLQNRFNSVKSIDERIHILTILPQSWTSYDVTKYFNCTGYIIREFRKSKETDGKSLEYV